jgi:hypothetical protein
MGHDGHMRLNALDKGVFGAWRECHCLLTSAAKNQLGRVMMMN